VRSGPSCRSARRGTTTGAAAPDAAPEYGSDLVVDLLASLGVDKLAMSPGATFRGLHDSLVNYAPDAVEVVDCLHEEISVAIAHGYAKAAGRPMAAAVHDVVGLQHASMAIFNAWCDRVPMLILGGSGPRDAAKRRPWIDWIHTANPQALQVRDYTKWDDEPGSLEALPESLLRAFHLSVTEPCGPVYVALDAELQEQKLAVAERPDPGAPATASFGRVSPEPRSVERLARWLVTAERPVIVADLVGRSEVAFADLVDLAELLAVPVIDREGEYWKVSLNFPTLHPLNLSGLREETLSDADLIVGLEARDLSGTIGASEAKLAHVSLSHLITRSWAHDYQRFQPVDLHLGGDLATTLPLLLDRVRTLLEADPAAPARIEQRRARVTERSGRMRAAWRAQAADDEEGAPISWSTLALALDEATAAHDRVVAYGHLGNWVHRLWDLDHPSQYLGGSGGAGLGYGLGASVGAALAHRGSGRLVIDAQADGDALFTPQALWTAAHHRLPMLVVVDNNQAYNNSVQHAGNVARRRGRDPERRMVGTAIGDPAVDFPALARSFGVFAEDPVERPEQLGAALGRAVAHVTQQGMPALVDVRTRMHTTKFDEGSQHER
jgi:acetolactate synthase-1/2/3 large subunit